MRLSFKHIQDPNSGGGDTSTTNSPFKKKLNDLFSGGTNKCFAFDDIFMNTSPDQQLRQRGSPKKQGSPAKAIQGHAQVPQTEEDHNSDQEYYIEDGENENHEHSIMSQLHDHEEQQD